ncbi:MAG: response regulator [Verrucomicrobiales bacterium VVV1]|nr:MAG: response regulator [Verrucomicrobiales bacterium VVV1]
MSKKIITVDDAATMRKMVAFTLKGAGHEVLEACDGQEALTVLSQRPVDLVITDVNMPNMDGLELTRRLRALPAFARTPIILLTTESDPAKKQQGRAAGATGWIVKPFNQDQLLAIVAKVLPA